MPSGRGANKHARSFDAVPSGIVHDPSCQTTKIKPWFEIGNHPHNVVRNQTADRATGIFGVHDRSVWSQ